MRALLHRLGLGGLSLLGVLTPMVSLTTSPAAAQPAAEAASVQGVSRQELLGRFARLRAQWLQESGIAVQPLLTDAPAWLQGRPEALAEAASLAELLWLAVRHLEASDRALGYSPRRLDPSRPVALPPEHWAAAEVARAIYDYQLWPGGEVDSPLTPAALERVFAGLGPYLRTRMQQLRLPSEQLHAVIPDPDPPLPQRPLRFPSQAGLRAIWHEYAESYAPDGLDILGSASAFGLQLDYSWHPIVLSAGYTRQSSEILRRFEPPPASGVLRVYQIADLHAGWAFELLENHWLLAPGLSYLFQHSQNLVTSGSRSDFLELGHLRHGFGPELATRVRIFEDKVHLQGRFGWYPLMSASHSPVREGFPTALQSLGGDLALQLNLDFPLRLQLGYQFLMTTDFKDYRQVHSGLTLGAAYFW